MAFDISAEFPLISERFVTGDFSRPSCPKLYIHLPAALAALGARLRTGLGRKISETGGKIGK
jgi:hypothetical protein